MNRTKAIENFLEKWDEMLEAANSIDGFEWNFKVSITSNNSMVQDRITAINELTNRLQNTT